MTSIRNVSIREKAYLFLRDAIIDGSLKPGERLVEDAIAAQFNVSRTPLREAIHKLELDGFLVRLPSRGLAVSELSVKEAKELYEVRSYLEGLATRVVTETLSEQGEISLLGIRREIEVRVEVGEFQAALDRCPRLHEFIRRSCTHSVCVGHLEKLTMHIARYRRIGVLQIGRPERAVREHLRVMDCMQAGRGEAAEQAMREHVLHSCDAALRSIEDSLA